MSTHATTLAGLGFLVKRRKSQKVRHRTMTAEKWARLEREADLRIQTTTNAVLANELGLSEIHVRRIVARLIAERRGAVPRLAHVFDATPAELDQFAADLMRE